MTPARLGEIMAHLAFYAPATQAEVAKALGYDDSVTDEIPLARAALVDAFTHDDDVAPMRAFVQAFDLTTRDLRARRPKLSSVRLNPALAPQAESRRSARRAAMVPLAAKAPMTPPPLDEPPAMAVPTYLHAQPLPLVPPLAPAVLPPAPSPVAMRAPITGTAAPPPPPAVSPIAVGTPRRSVRPPKVGLGSTSAMESGRLRPGRTLPFAKGSKDAKGAAPVGEAAAADPELTRFAQLTLALASGEDRAAVLARFKLTEAARQALSQEWGARISADSTLRTRFDEIIRRLKAAT